jgi:ribosome maturation factor RimP
LNKPLVVWVMTWWRSSAPPVACCASRLTCLGQPSAGPSKRPLGGGEPHNWPCRRRAVCHRGRLREGNRQLQFALEVDGIEYKRLEVSSPGIDRPLRHAQDFERFVGHVIDITLKAPMGALPVARCTPAARSFAARWRKWWRPMAQRVGKSSGAMRPGQARSKGQQKAYSPATAGLGFTLDELREARLAPIVSFKGRGGGRGTGWRRGRHGIVLKVAGLQGICIFHF